MFKKGIHSYNPVSSSGGGGNTLYSSDDALAGVRVVDLNTNLLTFSDGETSFIGSDSGAVNLTARFENSSNVKSLQVRNDGSVYNHGPSAVITDTFFGINSGVALTSAGDNTAMGKNALKLGAGGFSTAIGSEALASDTSGYYNVAVGYQAAFANVSSREITAVGYKALRANTSYSNSAFGYTALTANVAGSINCAFGNSSMLTNLNGSHNTAMGGSSLQSNSAGNFNNAFGSQALKFVTGSQNTGIGYNAGVANTTGSGNVYIGYTTGSANISGANNTFVGNVAGFASTGSANAFFGYTAGHKETGSSYIYLDVISRADQATGRIQSPLVIRAHATLSSQIVTTNGVGKLQPMTVAVAAGITAEEGMEIFVSDTDATWTAIGKWGYENGAWVKR